MKQAIFKFNQINSPLLKYRHNVTSQHGEDGIIEHIIGVLDIKNKFCVEFGAWDGKFLSNCYNLIANKGWSAAMIEASEEKFKALIETHGNNLSVCLHFYNYLF